MQIPKTAFAPLLLVTTAFAAPQPAGLNVKRQSAEIAGAVGGVVDNLVNHVFEWLMWSYDREQEDGDGWWASRQLKSKSTQVGCIGGHEKLVRSDWLYSFLQPMCANMTAEREGDLFVPEFPNALMSQSWTVKQPDGSGEWKGDWVDVIIAWQQQVGFNGDHVPMDQDLCTDMLKFGITTCSWDDPWITKGFSGNHNDEWVFWVDITDVSDADAEAAYGMLDPKQFPPGVQSSSDRLTRLGG